MVPCSEPRSGSGSHPPRLRMAKRARRRKRSGGLQKSSSTPCRVPVGVIGGRECTDTMAAVAHDLGSALADMGLTVLCGGKGGVMEATCQGVAEANGLSIGLLPDDHWSAANPYVSVPIASGIGVARQRHHRTRQPMSGCRRRWLRHDPARRPSRCNSGGQSSLWPAHRTWTAFKDSRTAKPQPDAVAARCTRSRLA